MYPLYDRWVFAPSVRMWCRFAAFLVLHGLLIHLFFLNRIHISDNMVNHCRLFFTASKS